jgi:hypothetical protein
MVGGLVEFRGDWERDIKSVISHHLVARIVLLQGRPVIVGDYRVSVSIERRFCA